MEMHCEKCLRCVMDWLFLLQLRLLHHHALGQILKVNILSIFTNSKRLLIELGYHVQLNSMFFVATLYLLFKTNSWKGSRICLEQAVESSHSRLLTVWNMYPILHAMKISKKRI